MTSLLKTPAQSAQEYGRGVAGGLIFSLPLLFTQEVWDIAFEVSPARLMVYLAATFAILLLYNRFAGLRAGSSWLECALDSVEELGIGLLVAASVLWLLGRFDDASNALEIVALVVMEGMTVAVGVSVGTAQLGQSTDENDVDETESESTNNFRSQIALAFCGSIVFVANIAPTEEIFLVASQSPPARLLLFMLVSLILGGYVLFFAEFRGSTKRPQGALDVIRAVIITYAVALLGTTVALFFFRRLDGETLAVNVAQIVVAGLAGSLGASAGRFLIQGNND